MKASLGTRIKFLLTGESWGAANAAHTNAFLRGDDISIGTVNADAAMKYSAVSACVRVRAETFASVPALMYRKTKDGRQQVSADDKDYPMLADILHSHPNEEMSPFGFKETLMTNFDVSGNIVCERLFKSTGELVGLYPYNHGLVKIERDKQTEKLVYTIGNGADKKTLQRSEILHIPNLSFDGVIGLSPISYAAQSIALGLSYEKFGVKFYENAANPSGVFQTDGKLSEPGYERLRKDLKENYTGLSKTGTPMLLEEGLKWAQVTINPIDAQLLESKYFQIEDIARIYRVPQHLINKLDRSTNNNIEHQSLEFVMYCMLPIFKRFEDAINSQLLTYEQRKAGMYVEFKIDGLLRGDAKSRAESYAIGRQWGWLSVNMILRLENMPGIGPQGDIFLTPANMLDSSKIGEQQAVQNYARLVEEIHNLIEKGGN